MLHIVGIALLLGNLVLFELRVWGVGARAAAAAAGAAVAAVSRWPALALIGASGLLMFAGQPAELLANRAFVIKMGLVLLAGLNAAWFHARGSLQRLDRTARAQTVVSTGALAGCHHLRPLDCLRLRRAAMQRRTFIAAALAAPLAARAHHGWSSFDQARPIYLEGRPPRWPGATRMPS